VAVPDDGTGTTSVAPVTAPPVPGVQKPPRHNIQFTIDKFLYCEVPV
jgi:hypothetical protein